LNRYEETGVAELARDRMPGLIKMSGLGTTRDASRAFGGSPANVLAAFRRLQQELYQPHEKVSQKRRNVGWISLAILASKHPAHATAPSTHHASPLKEHCFHRQVALLLK